MFIISKSKSYSWGKFCGTYMYTQGRILISGYERSLILEREGNLKTNEGGLGMAVHVFHPNTSKAGASRYP